MRAPVSPMKMLEGYRKMVDFFETMPYWRLSPIMAEKGRQPSARVLAEPGERYVLYLYNGGKDTVKLVPGRYRARRYDPELGIWGEVGAVEGSEWTTPQTPTGVDVAYLLERTK